ncbi:MAG TPA: hypothetical protein VMS55_21270 [Myxococcota bacterium]|nr:hypothetical protein [Myxococcota bacterium]
MIRRPLAFVVFVLALASPATGGGQPGGLPEVEAEPVIPTLPWDQGKVALISQQFADSIADLRREFGKLPQPEAGSRESRGYLFLSDDLRLMENEARELAARVSKGATQDESYPIYRRLRTIILDAREEAHRYEFPQPVQHGIVRARTLLIRLDAYYD